MFNASCETTSTALSWTMYLLAQHPSVYADLHDEVTAAIGDAAPSLDSLDQMPLLEHVLKESMRICPPVPTVARVAQETMEVEGLEIQEGDRIFCSNYMTHHWPQLYDNPQRFDPSRWEMHKPGPYDYVPFGAGSHVCIGFDFSMQLLRITLAMLVQRYRFSMMPDAQIDRKCTSIMGFKYGLPMQIHEQDRSFGKPVTVRGQVNQMVGPATAT
jgi:cytochrome P450